ncbi:MAG: hypothetical protein Q4D37_01280 [Oscillospiraceae bacterium]|nr:hypothetical protein [Oscillospiraceae bacterium]
MEEKTERKRVMADTYMEEVWEQQAIKNWSKPLHNFGVRQNAFNQSADRRIRELESENLRLQAEIRVLLQRTEELTQITKRQKERLRQEENRNREIFGRVAAQMDKMQAEMNRLRLSTQLNSNAIDRLLLQGETESDGELETVESQTKEQIAGTKDFGESVVSTEEDLS